MPGTNAFREFPDPKVLVGNHSQLCVFFQETIFRSINKKGPLCCFVIFTPPKTNMSFKKRGAWKTTDPFFGDMLFFGVYSMHYIHMALLILVDSPIPKIDLLAGLWPCSKDATLRSLLLLLLHGKRTEKRQQEKVFEKEVKPPKTETTKI